VDGEKILVASPELAKDPDITLHEDAHIAQQKRGKEQTLASGKPASKPTPTSNRAQSEREAVNIVKHATKGKILSGKLLLSPTWERVLYEDGCGEQLIEFEKTLKELEDFICQEACECLKIDLRPGMTYQRCLANAIRNKYYKNGYPLPGAKLWREVPFYNATNEMVSSKTNPALPTSNVIRPNTHRPDFLARFAEKIARFFEVKFPSDPTRGGRMPADVHTHYENTAKAQTGDARNLDILEVSERCGCEPKQKRETGSVAELILLPALSSAADRASSMTRMDPFRPGQIYSGPWIGPAPAPSSKRPSKPSLTAEDIALIVLIAGALYGARRSAAALGLARTLGSAGALGSAAIKTSVQKLFPRFAPILTRLEPILTRLEPFFP
jgi:hypothetical protein